MRLYTRPSQTKIRQNCCQPLEEEANSVADSFNQREQLRLPQPTHNGTTNSGSNKHYQYISGDTLEHIISAQSFFVGQNVWVCKSKGVKKSQQLPNDDDDGYGAPLEIYDDGTLEAPDTKRLQHHRYELFLRAIVVEVDVQQGNDRIRVQYPKGSTYNVRSKFLLPIVDSLYMDQMVLPSLLRRRGPIHASCCNNAIVLVYPETNLYRRACVLHTTVLEHFIEIGCAEGITCQRVYETSSNHHTDTTVCTNGTELPSRRIILGIDKSSSSIRIARNKYSRSSQHPYFVTGDVLTRHWNDDEYTGTTHVEHAVIVREIMQRLLLVRTVDDNGDNRSTMNHTITTNPWLHHDDADAAYDEPTTTTSTTTPSMVVAIDINGNRDIDPVLQCIQLVMNQLVPRLILVKSRSLYNQITYPS
jgi:hypothetical protein